jgi:hypothetical protein
MLCTAREIAEYRVTPVRRLANVARRYARALEVCRKRIVRLKQAVRDVYAMSR